MSNLTLKQFRYFEALARHGHFGRAADACSISQPALSMQIKELEQSLGVALFERGAKGVQKRKPLACRQKACSTKASFPKYHFEQFFP